MKILIIQQKMIGDVLTSSILFEILRAYNPDAELHYLIYNHTYPVIENNPFIDKVIHFNEKDRKSTQLYSLIKEVRRERYDVVIDVYSKLGSAIISSASGAPMTISYKKWYTAFCYSHTVSRKRVPTINAGLAIEHRLDLLLPFLDKTPTPVKPKIYLTNSEISHAAGILSNYGFTSTKPLIMVAVLGSSMNKTYPLEYLAQLLDDMVSITNANLLFNFIPSQKRVAESILNLCKPETQKNIHLDIFGSSLRNFMALTSHCHALIGNEGGAVNMAKALDIPTFSIFSPQVSREDWGLFENGTTHCSVHLNDYKPDLLKGLSRKEINKKTEEFYREFRPEFIKEELVRFLVMNKI